MKKTSAISMVLAVALLGIGSSAYAAYETDADKLSNYMVFKAGAYSPSDDFDLRNVNAGETTRFDSKTGFNGEIAFGHYILPFLAVEVGAGYFESKGSPATPVGESKLKVVPVVATGKVLLPMGPFEPYGEFGIGAYVTKLDVNGNLRNFDGTTKVTYGLHAGAGFNVNVTDTVFLGLEGRYIWVKPEYGGDDIKLNGFTTTANLGLRF